MRFSDRLRSSLALISSCLCLMNCDVLRAAPPEGSGGIVITILEGEGALNDIRQRTAREPIVQVDDENHRPIAGAAVVFLLPQSGPGGTFADGSLKFSTVTDSNGRAVGKGLQPNKASGSYQIQVIVTVAAQVATATIHQQNVSNGSDQTQNNHSAPTPRPVHALPVKVIVITAGSVVAAGTIIAVLVTRGGSSTVITAGPPTVGPPTPAAHAGIQIPLHFRSR